MSLPEERWPVPVYTPDIEPHFLFIITPPFSGSTALAAIINTSSSTTFLQEQAEGQWLVPGLCEKGRWDPDKYVNYDSVKAVWLSAYQENKRADPNIDVVIEKSPPNMMRIQELTGLFRRVSCLANNRDPCANCASILYRNFDAKLMASGAREEKIRELAEGWVRRSARIRDIVSRYQVPLITYEAFCRDPSVLRPKLQLPEPVVNEIRFAAEIKVKDYDLQPIRDQNERQIARLTKAERKAVRRVVERDPALLRFFDY